MNKSEIIKRLKKIYHFIYRPATADHIRRYTERPYGIRFIGKNLGKVLEVGCGAAGIFTSYLVKNASYLVAMEIQEKYIEEARERLSKFKNKSFVRANALSIPFTKNYFDLVVCSQVLEHIKDDSKVLRGINRVMKDRGRLVLSVPVPPEVLKLVREDLFYDGHVREGYRMEDLERLLKNEGFVVKRFKYCFFKFARLAVRMNEFFVIRLGIRLPALFVIALSFFDRFVSLFIKILPWQLIVEAEKIYANK